MEASIHMLRRRFLTSLIRAGRCECRTSQNHPSRSPFLRQTTSLGPSSVRSFASSTRKWLEEVSESDMKVSSSLTHPSSPTRTTPKQALETYISSIQKIIDGYQLDNKDNLHEKLHSDLVLALSNAQARLDAPGAASESFDPLLKSLQGEVAPILKNRFRTTDVSEIIADIGQRSAKQAQDPQSQPQRPRGLADAFDEAFASTTRPNPQAATNLRSDSQKFSSLHSMLGSEPPRTSTSNLKNAYSQEGTITSAFARSEQYLGEIHTSKNKGPSLRLSSSLGKSVEVTGATDLTRAFQRMEMICARNAVRRDLARQRFHVRRGQLKKNLRMERWRRLFKEGFMAECGRVRRMRRQGW